MLFYWEPVELPEKGSHMVVFLGPTNNPTGKVLDLYVAMLHISNDFGKNNLERCFVAPSSIGTDK